MSIIQNKKNEYYDLLVLMDFSESSYISLKYAISLAKITQGNIHVCHIGNPEKIVESNNQAAALRAIESNTKKVENKLASIIEIITTEGIQATCHHTIGNIINELESVLDVVKADLIVVGKKKEKSKFSGKLSDYLLNNYSGSLLITGMDGVFKFDSNISLACNENTLRQYPPVLVNKIERNTTSSLKLIKVKVPVDSNWEIDIPKSWQSFYTINLNIQFEHEEASTVVNGLINHINKNKIDMLCIGRGQQRSFLQRLFTKKATTISKIVNKTNIPVLIVGTNSNQLN
jgi:nucleotide-binding universal stress UspA family protein